VVAAVLGIVADRAGEAVGSGAQVVHPARLSARGPHELRRMPRTPQPIAASDAEFVTRLRSSCARARRCYFFLARDFSETGASPEAARSA
jgi:hypothetical protein